MRTTNPLNLGGYDSSYDCVFCVDGSRSCGIKLRWTPGFCDSILDPIEKLSHSAIGLLGPTLFPVAGRSACPRTPCNRYRETTTTMATHTNTTAAMTTPT